MEMEPDGPPKWKTVIDRIPRQSRIAFVLACKGASNAEIADHMAITPSTVKNHLTTAYAFMAAAGVGTQAHHKRSYFAYLTGVRDGIQWEVDQKPRPRIVKMLTNEFAMVEDVGVSG